MYILKGVHKYLYFDPQTYIFYKSIPNGRKKCTSDIIFPITDRDSHLQPQLLLRSLNIDHLNHMSLVGTIEPDKDSEVIDIPIDYGTSQYCLSAYIQESSNPLTDNYTSILVNPEPRPAALVISVFVTVFLFLIVMIEVIICCCLVCRKKIQCNCTHREIGLRYEQI